MPNGGVTERRLGAHRTTSPAFRVGAPEPAASFVRSVPACARSTTLRGSRTDVLPAPGWVAPCRLDRQRFWCGKLSICPKLIVPFQIDLATGIHGTCSVARLGQARPTTGGTGRTSGVSRPRRYRVARLIYGWLLVGPADHRRRPRNARCDAGTQRRPIGLAATKPGTSRRRGATGERRGPSCRRNERLALATDFSAGSSRARRALGATAIPASTPRRQRERYERRSAATAALHFAGYRAPVAGAIGRGSV
jgi:hypothetical protein